MPRAAWLASRCFHSASKAGAELIAPASDCLVRHDHAALEEQLFDVAQAQLEAEVPAHCATDNTRRKTVTVIQRFGFLHRTILRDQSNNLTTPFQLMMFGVDIATDV